MAYVILPGQLSVIILCWQYCNSVTCSKQYVESADGTVSLSWSQINVLGPRGVCRHAIFVVKGMTQRRNIFSYLV